MVDKLGADFSRKFEPVMEPAEDEFPQPQITADFVFDVERTGISHSLRGSDRLFRSHGHTIHEIFYLRHGKYPRIPDIVAWPEKHDEVVTLVDLALKHNVTIIPYGGGTSVSGALSCPESEERPIMSVDTSQMVKLLMLELLES